MKLRIALLCSIAAFASCSESTADSAIPKDYPLKKCPVSGEEYGSKGMKPFKVTHEGTDVWFCCKGCKKDFDKDPAKYVKMVKDAAAKK